MKRLCSKKQQETAQGKLNAVMEYEKLEEERRGKFLMKLSTAPVEMAASSFLSMAGQMRFLSKPRF